MLQIVGGAKEIDEETIVNWQVFVDLRMGLLVSILLDVNLTVMTL